MSDFVFTLSTAAIGFLGLAMAIHLLFFGSEKVSAKLLGGYTFLLTLSSLEPLTIHLAAPYWAETMIGMGAFMIGPTLYLYCHYRISGIKQWKRNNIVHFLPAAILLFLIIISPRPPVDAGESETDIILYLLFVIQLFSYTMISLFLILKTKGQKASPSSLEQFHLSFILILVVSSLVLFGHSFISTMLGANQTVNFRISIQAFLTLLILVVVLLNAETLEDHNLTGKTKKIFRRK
jgi:hypothetical protein